MASCTDVDEFEDTEFRRSETEVIVENLQRAGFPDDEIGVLPDGTVFVGSDAVVTLQASRELAGITDDLWSDEGFRQFRTTNIINTAVVNVICINPTTEFVNNALMLQALEGALDKYNALNLDFSMKLGGGGCDASIAANLDNSGGGIAGFPADGLPYHEFFVGQNLASNYGVPVATHVITHELGHTIGFRHSDYYDRSISCGGGPSNEGDSDVGAVHIPGTPSTAVMNGSVMDACYNGNSNGEWTSSDLVALDCLFDSGSCAPPPPPDYSSVTSYANQSGSKNQQTHYGPFDASGLDALRIRTSGGSGDADLYVKIGGPPTTNDFDCRPYVGGNTETCEFNPADNADYYVMINGYRAYSGLTLEVDGAGNVQQPPDPEPDPGSCGNGVCDVGESCDGRDGTSACGDCDGKTGGKPSSRFCYVEGVCEGPGC